MSMCSCVCMAKCEFSAHRNTGEGRKILNCQVMCNLQGYCEKDTTKCMPLTYSHTHTNTQRVLQRLQLEFKLEHGDKNANKIEIYALPVIVQT